ncbi:MAG: hypothetical protein IKO84_13240 [Butyrivibrio sp.]|nr:hypothetical protein [Butyrivibrio sp.]
MNRKADGMSKLKRYAMTLLFPIGMYIVFAVIALASGNMNFFKSYIIKGMLHDTVLNTIVALAIAIPLSGGRWDFGPGAIVMLGAIIGGNIGMSLGLGSMGILLTCIASCIVLALVEAVLYVTLKVPNMIISLGVVMVFEALGGLIYNGLGVNFYAADAVYLKKILAVNEMPYIFILLLVICLAVWFLLYKTKFGYDTKSLGNNSRLAVNSGVNEKKNIILTYVLIGALLGCAAMLNACTAKVEPLNNLSSTGLMFGSMAPVLIGLFLANFTNMPWGIFVAALGMEVFGYGLNAFKIDASIQTIVTGVVLALIMAYINDGARITAFINRLFRPKTKEMA